MPQPLNAAVPKTDWVLILNYRLTDMCLRRLRELGHDGRFGVLFVDNASPGDEGVRLRRGVCAEGGIVLEPEDLDDEARVRQALGHPGINGVLLCSPGNLGYSAGNNIGLRALRTAFGEAFRCVILNPDVEVDPDVIVALFEHPAEIAGPAIHEDYLNGLRGFEDRCDFSTGFCDAENGAPAELLGVRLCGCCFKVSGAALARYGLLPEECFLYDEETFFFARVWRGGGRPAYLPELVVRHAGSAAEGKKGFNYFYYIFRNRLLFFRREARPRGASTWRFARLYLAWWWPVLWRQLKHRNIPGSKGLVKGLIDGLRGRSGRYTGPT